MKEQTIIEKLYDKGVLLIDFMDIPKADIELSYDEYGVFITPTINGDRGYFFRPGPSLKELLGNNKIDIDISLWQQYINDNAHCIVIRIFENKKSGYKRFYNISKTNTIKNFEKKKILDIQYCDFSECRKKEKSKLLMKESDFDYKYIGGLQIREPDMNEFLREPDMNEINDSFQKIPENNI